MQFNEILVRQTVFASDTLAVVNTLAPDPGELQVGGQFAVNLQGQVFDRSLPGHSEWCFEVSRLSRRLGVDADDLKSVVDGV